MTGGITCPLTDAATSMAAAFSAGYPTRLIRGIVSGPVVTTLVMDEPEIMPVAADATTAALAGPPRKCPSNATALRMK